MGFWLIVKENDYYNVHRKCQAHNTDIVVLGANKKKIYRKVVTTPYP